MGKPTIIGEKPSVAKSIAYAVNSKVSRKDGYFEGDKFNVTFVFGHMYELYDMKDYEERLSVWSTDNYPYVPKEYKYKARADKGVKAQLKTIKTLANDSDYVVVASDADMEGNLLGDILIKELKINKPLKRLWISSHTPEEVNKGMNNLRDYSAMHNQIQASYCRQLLDYVLGVNLTVLTSVAYGGGKLLNIGRVILGTLRLIYDRDMEIDNFKSVKYFELKSIFESNNQQYQGRLLNEDKETRFDNRKILEQVKVEVDGKEGVIESLEKKKVVENAPLLFNLNDLQGHISSKYNIGADKTKTIAQSLYEKGYISYPRTASRHLDDTQADEIKRVLDIFIKEYPSDYNIAFNKSKRMFDSKKVDSHPALTPTYVIPKDKSKDEALIYNEIKLRFISVFMPANEYEQTTVITNIKDHRFITKEKILVKKGWIKLYKESDKEGNKPLDLKENRLSKSVHTEIEEKDTEPPKKYNEKSLLKAMETCGKKVDEEDVEYILKGYSIGTADTRATTIKKLLDIGYIKKSGKSLETTPLGREIIEVFPVDELKDIDFTGRIQKSLKDIEKGEIDPEIFMRRMEGFVFKNAEKFKVKKLNSMEGAKGSKKEKKVIGKCPDCGSDVIEGKKAYGCSNWKSGCKFAIWFNQLENLGMKKINLTAAKKLLNNEKPKVKLHSKKKNKDFECSIYLEKENEKWNIKLEFPS